MQESTLNATNLITNYTTILEENDDGDLVMTIPPQVLDYLGWVESDTIQFSIENHSIIMRKQLWI
jgi:hypothetical protein